ncbi:zinc finger protein 253-like [Varroa destructor]|uniref:C2H2-type domain-containing protein n=1 Tax=Varroa destructor TaxID=109461 RepID=A0A7M7JQL5_VARDE|nr:zinc finger protein 253-like [Varroa destructor]
MKSPRLRYRLLHCPVCLKQNRTPSSSSFQQYEVTDVGRGNKLDTYCNLDLASLEKIQATSGSEICAAQRNASASNSTFSWNHNRYSDINGSFYEDHKISTASVNLNDLANQAPFTDDVLNSNDVQQNLSLRFNSCNEENALPTTSSIKPSRCVCQKPCESYDVVLAPCTYMQTDASLDTGFTNSCGRHHPLAGRKKIRTDEKRFPCDQCPERFISLYKLKRHKRIHTGEKPFSCEQCPKMFRSQASLNCHKKIHTREKPFSCEQCPKMFRWPSSLSCHKKIHTREKPFSCEQCPKMFRWPSSLSCHKKIHNGEKLFSCDQCPKMFTWPTSLSNHKRTHTGDRLFSRNQCPKRA